MPEPKLRIDRVSVASAFFGNRQIAGADQFRNDSLNHALRDANGNGDIT
jgi:hypothetical protein